MKALIAAVALAAALFSTGATAQAGTRSHNPYPGYHGRNPGFWGFGNDIGRHHRFGPFSTPGGYPRGMDSYVRQSARR